MKDDEIEERTPNAKKKVKIAEKMFPRMAESAEVKKCLSLRSKLWNENDDETGEDEGGDGYV
ncbi:hypothetical protein Hanom_Chr14g01296091 [Helianthus anomalus]